MSQLNIQDIQKYYQYQILKFLNIIIYDIEYENKTNINEELNKLFNLGFYFSEKDLNDLIITLEDNNIHLLLINNKLEKSQDIISLFKKKYPNNFIININDKDSDIKHPYSLKNILFKIEKNEKIFLNLLKQDDKEEVLFDEENFSIQKVLNIYFKEYEKINENYQINNEQEFLNFNIMKQFVFKAYDNLTTIEPHLKQNEEIYKIKKPIDELLLLNNRLFIKTKHPLTILYNSIVLNKLKSYKQIKKELIKHIDNQRITTSLKPMMENKLELTKKKLSQLNKKDEKYQILLREYKKINKNNIDNLHELSISEKKIINLTQEMLEIENKYKNEFEKKFKIDKEKYLLEITKYLNFLLFKLEKILWFEAKKSDKIIQYFESTQIKGLYASKTYLEYFVKNIQKSNNIRSQKYKNYLKEYNKTFIKKIYLLSNDNNFLLKNKLIIENIDTTIQCFNYKSVIDLVKDFQDDQVSIIILDNNLMKTNQIKIIKFFKDRFNQFNRFICLYNNNSKLILNKIKEMNPYVKYLYKYNQDYHLELEKLIKILI